MRIAIFTEIMSPKVSGISSYVEVLRKGLTELGHQVLVVTSSQQVKTTVAKNGIVRCPAKSSLNKYGYECSNINDRKATDRITRFRPDVIHIQTDTRIGYMGLQIADKLRLPVVFTVHDFYSDRFASDNRLVWYLKTSFEKRHFCDMLDNAQIITSSNRRASQFIRTAGRKRKVLLIPMATDKKRFDYRRTTEESKEKLRSKLDIPSSATVAVFAGDLSVDKNLEFVISAFAKCIRKSDNIHFLVVGEGTELSYLRSHCAKMHITDRVHFTGVVSHTIMPDVYSACDAYVCSSDDSLMSMSFMEAMACGLPVLVKEDKEQFVQHMIRHGVNGFTYDTKESFAAYMKKIAGFSPEKKAQLKQIVRNSIRTTGAEEMAATTVKAYRLAMKAYGITAG